MSAGFTDLGDIPRQGMKAPGYRFVPKRDVEPFMRKDSTSGTPFKLSEEFSRPCQSMLRLLHSEGYGC